MTQNPMTELSQRRLIETAKSVQAENEAYYDGAPVGYIALQIREFSKFCEESGIDDPSDIKTVVKKVFQPHPVQLKRRDAEFLMHLIVSNGAGSSGKVRAILNFLDSRKE